MRTAVDRCNPVLPHEPPVSVRRHPGHPAFATFAGPTIEPEELAGRKVLALFDRAEARDFVDVYLLTQRFSTETLLARTSEMDAGFDRAVFAEIRGTLTRFTDQGILLDDQQITELRRFFARWRGDLT